MKLNLKHGFPVLVYLTSEEPLSLPFTLRIQHHEPRKQVTLMLRVCVSLHGVDEQAFVAQYDADNVTVGDAIVDIPEDRGDGIARNPTSSQLTTLTLQLNHPCPLWCPRSEALLPAPPPVQVEAFSELAQLAKAVTLRVVFDYNWLSLDARVPYQRLVKGKERLTGFPVHEYYSRFYRLADWRAFGPIEAPDTVEASNKRQRRGKHHTLTALSPLTSQCRVRYRRLRHTNDKSLSLSTRPRLLRSQPRLRLSSQMTT